MADRTVKVSLIAQVSGYVGEMQRARKATQDTGNAAQDNAAKFERQQQAMTEVGTALTAVGAVAVAATALAVKAAVDWESAWAGVTKTVDGTDSQMAELEGSLREMARTLPATHQQIAAVAEAAGQLGVRREDIAAFSRTMIDLGETTNLTADEAATSIAQLMNVMQTAPEDVDNLGAALVALGNDGASTERDIIQMAQRIAGAGKVVGLTEAQVLGFANALASVGIEAEAGGTAISRIMVDIARAVAEGGSDLEGFAQVAGMSSAAFQKAFKDDPAAAIATFIAGLGQINRSGGNLFKTLSDLGQSDIRVQQALLGMANSGDLLRKSLDLGSRAWKENTALTDEAAKRYETTQAKLQILGNKATDAAIAFGDTFLPAIGAVAEAIGGLLDAFNALPEGMQQQIAFLTTLAAVATLAGGAFLLAVPRIAEFGVALATLRESQMPGVARAAGLVTTGISRTASAFSNAAAVLGGPWGIAITVAIAAVGQLLASQEAARQKVVQYASTMDEASGKISDATRKMVKDALSAKNSFLWMEQDSAYDAAEKLGISLDLVTEAALGNAGAMKELQRQIDSGADGSLAYANSAVDIENAVRGESASIEEAIKQQEQKQKADKGSAESSNRVTGAMQESTAATDAATQANEEYIAALAQGDNRFVNFGDALSTLQGKQRQWAETTAQDTESSTDSWQDYYDGFSVNLEEYLGELQRQIDAQSAWEQNMILLAGRASEGVIAELSALGPEGAPLVADLVNATDEQLAIMERAFGERSASGTQSFANTLINAAPVIAQAGAQLGQGAATEIAAKLASGTTTVEQIISEYKLKIESNPPRLTVDTSVARQVMESFATNDGLGWGVKVTVGAGIGARNGFAAGGGIYGPGPKGVDSVPILAAPGEHMLTASDVDRMGGQQAVYRFRAGLQAGKLRGYAGGGEIRPSFAPPPQYAASGGGGYGNRTVTIAPVIYAAPGMDENAIVDKAVRKIQGALR